MVAADGCHRGKASETLNDIGRSASTVRAPQGFLRASQRYRAQLYRTPGLRAPGHTHTAHVCAQICGVALYTNTHKHALTPGTHGSGGYVHPTN